MNGCDHPLLSPYATTGVNAWMTQAVVVMRDGSTMGGAYNGYAHIETEEVSEQCIVHGEDDPCVWHEACWNKAGRPTDHRPSNSADDQGWFFDHRHGHQMEEPK